MVKNLWIVSYYCEFCSQQKSKSSSAIGTNSSPSYCFTNHGSTTYEPDTDRFVEMEILNSIKNILTIVSSTLVAFMKRDHTIEDAYCPRPVMHKDIHILDHM
jgi:hypothetical protein